MAITALAASARTDGFHLGVDALVTRFAGFATDFFRASTHPLETANRGTLFMPFEARLHPTDKPMRIVVAALNGPELSPSHPNTRFKAFGDLGVDGKVATKYGCGEQNHVQAFNTLEQLFDESPDRLEIRPATFPIDLIEMHAVPRPVCVSDLSCSVYNLHTTQFKLKL